SGGVNNWGNRLTQGNALGYVPPSARSNSQFMDYAKFIQRDVRARSMKALDDGDGEYKAVVDVGDAEVNDSGVDCASLRKQKNAVLPPECRAKNI
ncbi:hypothetical protein, partial [Flavobacterium alvei]|uniref:hypothetical protein n=1 Tax=Flavobacterium alvei TaxID=2080416 RepID=UPI0026F34F6E